jgi:hypothetical protein
MSALPPSDQGAASTSVELQSLVANREREQLRLFRDIPDELAASVLPFLDEPSLSCLAESDTALRDLVNTRSAQRSAKIARGRLKSQQDRRRERVHRAERVLNRLVFPMLPVAAICCLLLATLR